MKFDRKSLVAGRMDVDNRIAEIEAFFSGTLSLGITLEQRVQLRRLEQALRDQSAVLTDLIATVA